jgi:predicted sugar kinase
MDHRMTLDEVKKVIESMRELSVDVEYFSWGPSHELAVERKREALRILKAEQRFLQEAAAKKILDGMEEKIEIPLRTLGK